MIDDGARLGVSSRGLGSLEQKGDAQVVKGDFQLATAADIVADPSAPEAFVDGIMEGVEWIYESGVFKPQQIEKYETEIRKASSSELAEAQVRVFSDFLSKL